MLNTQGDTLKILLFNTINNPILIYPLLDEGFASFKLVNKAASKLYEYSEKELCQLNVLDITKPKYGNEHEEKEHWEKLKRTEKQNFEAIHISKSGKEIPVEISETVVDLQGQQMIFAVIRDITEKKQNEKKLIDTINRANDTANMLKDIVNTIPVRLFWKDRESNYLGSNQLFANDAGCNSPIDLIGKTDYELFDKEIAKAFRKDDHEVVSHEKPKINYEELQSGKKREQSWLNTSKVPLRNHKGEVYGVLGTYEDITLRKQQEEELRKHKDKLELLVQEKTEELETSNEELAATNEEMMSKNEIINAKNIELQDALNKIKETQTKLLQADKMASLGILTAGISHELNNPLNFIQGGYAGLKKIFEDENEKVSQMLRAIKTGVERAAKIISGLNQFNRSNDNFNETCDIHSIIENSLVMLGNQLKHRIEINKDFYPQGISVKGNVGKLHQVFVNLLSNASHAIGEQGSINISTDLDESNVTIIIKDTGCGIEKELISHVFDPFYTTKEPGLGTGLGLSISYTIMQEHQGTIEFKSEKNKGTTVIITLPI